MQRHEDSHLDHQLTPDQVAYLLARFAGRSGFFIETFELPAELGTVPCGLYGPLMGDPPIETASIVIGTRGDRAWPSRLIGRPARPTRMVTVIAGPHKTTCTACLGSGRVAGTGPGFGASHPCPIENCQGGSIEHACVLHTAFGGPLAPQEPGDLLAQKNAIEAQRIRLSDLTDEHKVLTAKRDALRDKLVASRAFWDEHALAVP